MAGMGPPPKNPTARARRNATVAMTALPAEGRQKPTPAWPLADDVRLVARQKLCQTEIRRLQRERRSTEDGRTRAKLDRSIARLRNELALVTEQARAQRDLELGIWADLWATPQATAWERLRWTREVATYVRLRVYGELGDLNASKEARQYSDRLGLNPLAMLRLRWAIASDELEPRRQHRAGAEQHDADEPPLAEAQSTPEETFAALRAV